MRIEGRFFEGRPDDLGLTALREYEVPKIYELAVVLENWGKRATEKM